MRPPAWPGPAGHCTGLQAGGAAAMQTSLQLIIAYSADRADSGQVARPAQPVTLTVLVPPLLLSLTAVIRL